MGARDQNDAASRAALARIVAWGTLALLLLTFWELTYPLKFSAAAPGPWLAVERVSRIDALGNVALFVPWAAGAGWLLQMWGWRHWKAVAGIAAAGAGLSLGVETLQVWLPGRDSSLNDLVANTLGAALGSWAGFYWAPRWTRVLVRWRQGLVERVWSRRLVWAVLAMAALAWAPADVAPQVDELKRGWHRMVAGGWPLHAMRAWLAGGSGWAAAGELAGAAVAALVAGVVGFLMAAALRQQWSRRGERSAPAGFALLGAGALVVVMEVGKLAVRSRSVSATELCAALAGVVVGVTVEAGRGKIRNLRLEV